MRAGLVGFSGSGKSTLFQLLTGATPDPGRVHSGQIAVAVLNDDRLDYLAQLHNPKKITPATIEFVDTPGLIPGTHGDNPQRLAIIREVDALVIVLGTHAGTAPIDELTSFQEELLFADLSVVTNRAERLEASLKKPRPDREQQLHEFEVVKKVLAALESGTPVALLELTAEEKKPMRSFGLLTDKAQVAILNGPAETPIPPGLLTLVDEPLVIDAKLELELSQLGPEERAMFQEEMGIKELGRDRIIRRAYDAVGMITFFTAGDPEVRGWNLERDASAVEAAGKIHTDLAKGFIRAEVTAFSELKEAGSLREAKARNLQRLEGKDYIVKDGDVVYFRSSV